MRLENTNFLISCLFRKSLRVNVVLRKSGRSHKKRHCLLTKHWSHCWKGRRRGFPVPWKAHPSEPGRLVVSVVPVGDRGSSLCLQVSEVTVEQLVQQYPHITFSTVLQDCKRTLERAYQMGWTPNMSAASSWQLCPRLGPCGSASRAERNCRVGVGDLLQRFWLSRVSMCTRVCISASRLHTA